MTKPPCEHLTASIAASGALVIDSTGQRRTGSLRWCPECGAIRSERFGYDGERLIGAWMCAGEHATIEASVQALRDEAAHNARRAARGDGLDGARQALGLPMEPEHA